MAHHAVKLAACANCHYAFLAEEPDEFCPRCGQLNRAPDIELRHLLAEALEGFFHFDNKVWRTLRLLLLRPGELTRRFLVGNRVSYVPPIRLYLLISFVFFLVQSFPPGKGPDAPSASQPRPSTLTKAAPLSAAKPAPTPAPIATPTAPPPAPPPAPVRGAPAPPAAPQPAKLTWGGLSFSAAELARLPRHVSAVQVDSLLRSKHKPLTFWNRFAVQRVGRWHGAGKEEIRHQALRAGSILLFLLMPLAALLLKLAYWRCGRFYLNHLIFTLHLHCFLFLLLLLAQLVGWLLPDWDGIGWLLLVPYWYFVLALRRVYGQGWPRTLVKSLVLSFSYSFLFGFAIVVVLAFGAAVF